MTEQPNSRNGAPHEVPPSGPEADPPIDLRRVADAVRRNGRPVAVAVALVTSLVLAVSVLSPERYRASARIAVEPADAAVDIATADRQLATGRELVTTPAVLAQAARRIPGESAESLEAAVSARVDPATSILDVVVTGGDPQRVALVANFVAASFVAESERVERLAATRARERLALEIDRLTESGAPATTLDAMRQRLSELAATEATAGAGLRIAQPAAAPSAAYAPHPLRSALFALLATLVVAVLVVVARDRVRPQAPDAGVLSRILGLPLIAALPAARDYGPAARLREITGWQSPGSRALDQAVIEEAALQGAVRAALPPRRQRLVLVHDIDGDADGATQVATGLARSLAWGGHATVLVRFEPARGRSLAPTGVPTLLCSDIDEQLAELRGGEFRYIVVQSPRVARGARLRPLAAYTTAAVLVARLGHATEADAAAARRLVDALGLRGLGLVVTCSVHDGPAISLAAPPRPPSRGRTASQNGVPTPAAPAEAPFPSAAD